MLLLIFIVGIIIGSFINVVIDRIPEGKFLSHTRSKCESCTKILKWYDLFPLISYIVLRGRCRYCNAPIPSRIFIVEVLTGIGFVILYFATSGLPVTASIFPFVFFCILLAIFFIDFKHYIIPDILLLILLITTLLYHVISRADLLHYILTGIGSMTFFLLLFLVTKGRGMGFGDVKFAFVIGFLLGFPGALVSFYAAFVTGAIISLMLIVSRKKKLKGSRIPFGPFMILGVGIALLFTDLLISFFF